MLSLHNHDPTFFVHIHNAFIVGNLKKNREKDINRPYYFTHENEAFTTLPYHILIPKTYSIFRHSEIFFLSTMFHHFFWSRTKICEKGRIFFGMIEAK